ncbi:hypothetical protein QUB33_13195 [Microcoleus sp. B3-A4]|uniref:hypothetical protein n=1 Tax=Microcoleus sp. B3-A4 TaxID=2818653 RepID=UPI002FCF066D
MICALAIASVTRRTCVLSIIPVVTIIRITQGIRSGGCKLRFLQNREKLLLLQGLRSLSTASGRSQFQPFAYIFFRIRAVRLLGAWQLWQRRKAARFLAR